MVDGIEENVVIGNVDESGLELSSGEKEGYKVLKLAMKSTNLLYDIPFQRRLEAIQKFRADIFEGVQVVIWDQSYNTRLTQSTQIQSKAG